MQKKMKEEVLQDYISNYDLEKEVDTLIIWLKQLKNIHEAQGYTSLRFEIEYDYDRDSHLQLRGLREETDKEYKRRLADNRNAKLRRKADKEKADKTEKALYEKLKEKYETPV